MVWINKQEQSTGEITRKEAKCMLIPSGEENVFIILELV